MKYLTFPVVAGIIAAVLSVSIFGHATLAVVGDLPLWLVAFGMTALFAAGLVGEDKALMSLPLAAITIAALSISISTTAWSELASTFDWAGALLASAAVTVTVAGGFVLAALGGMLFSVVSLFVLGAIFGDARMFLFGTPSPAPRRPRAVMA